MKDLTNYPLPRETDPYPDDDSTESIHQSFLCQLPGLAWVIDEEHRLTFASDAFYREYGLRPAEALNRKLIELVPETVSRALVDVHLRVLQTGRPEELIRTAEMTDGREQVFHIRIFLIFSAEGNKLACGIALPLEENTKMEARLKEANEQLMFLRNATTDAIWEWDMQTGSMVRNEALMEMVGYFTDRSAGMAWWLRRIHPEDRNRVSDRVKEATENQESSWQEEYRFKCADGGYKYIRDRGFVIYENGLPVKMIGCLTDVSRIREMEEALARERLQKQKDLSEKIVRMQELERAKIGRELHDNVTQVISCSKWFMEMLTPLNRDQIMVKEKSLEYLLLAIAEIRKLSTDLAVPELKEDGLVASVQSLLKDVGTVSRVTYTLEANPEVEKLSPGRKVTLFRIIQEQVRNIQAHSKACVASLYLGIEEGNVHLVICDDGTGFDPTKTHKGSGLTNMLERVKSYGGTMKVSSGKEQGCTLNICIPLE